MSLSNNIVILVLFCQLYSMVASYCMVGCRCNNTMLVATCNTSNLDMVPITLNPHITKLLIHNSRIKLIDDSFQFYEALVILDLSRNQITTIQDRAFISQVFTAR